MKYCPKCSKVVGIYDSSCQNCNEQLEAAQLKEFCKKCKAGLKNHYKCCPLCGEKIKEEPLPPPLKKEIVSDTKHCRHCGATLTRDSTYCTMCGGSQKDTTGLICWKCRKVSENNSFCTHCGASQRSKFLEDLSNQLGLDLMWLKMKNIFTVSNDDKIKKALFLSLFLGIGFFVLGMIAAWRDIQRPTSILPIFIGGLAGVLFMFCFIAFVILLCCYLFKRGYRLWPFLVVGVWLVGGGIYEMNNLDQTIRDHGPNVARQMENFSNLAILIGALCLITYGVLRYITRMYDGKK